MAAYASGSLKLMALPVPVESTVTFMIMLAPVARRWRLKARTNRPGRTRAIGASCHRCNAGLPQRLGLGAGHQLMPGAPPSESSSR